MRPDVILVALITALQTVWPYVWICMRPVLGWSSILVGILGVILPIIPGIPFLVVGVTLVGRRTWIIRWVAVNWKYMLRRWATSPVPVFGTIGRWAWRSQQEVSRQRRRLVWYFRDAQRRST